MLTYNALRKQGKATMWCTYCQFLNKPYTEIYSHFSHTAPGKWAQIACVHLNAQTTHETARKIEQRRVLTEYYNKDTEYTRKYNELTVQLTTVTTTSGRVQHPELFYIPSMTKPKTHNTPYKKVSYKKFVDKQSDNKQSDDKQSDDMQSDNKQSDIVRVIGQRPVMPMFEPDDSAVHTDTYADWLHDRRNKTLGMNDELSY